MTKKKTTKKKAAPAEAHATAAVWMLAKDLVPWIENEKIRLNKGEVDGMMALLKKHGFWEPITAWEDAPQCTYEDGRVQATGHRICSGHLRTKASLRLFREAKRFAFPGSPGPGYVPVRMGPFESEGMFEEQAVIANYHLGKWIAGGRDDLLKKLMSNGADIKGMGVESDVLAGLMADAADVDLGAVGEDDDDDDGGNGNGGGEDADSWGDHSSVIQYQIVFDDNDQKLRWYHFIRALKRKHPEIENIGGRIDAFLRESADVAALSRQLHGGNRES